VKDYVESEKRDLKQQLCAAGKRGNRVETLLKGGGTGRDESWRKKAKTPAFVPTTKSRVLEEIGRNGAGVLRTSERDRGCLGKELSAYR